MDSAPTPAPRTSLRSQVFVAASDRGGRPNLDYQKCRVCARHHALRTCPLFRRMQPAQRYLLARAHNYCTNCLALSHATSECTSQITCRICALPHHTMLHRAPPPPQPHRRTTAPPAQTPPTPASRSNAKQNRRNPPTQAATHRYNPTAATITQPRTVKCSATGLHTAAFREKTANRLMDEAIRALEQLKVALAV
ncbi:uncharacterized protein LOC118735025 [Rhagoletis pomonella]|uniref:uncharacterized protein LOC118735025 n=1 Tax=Rhagoletis pomonella TaxID=28610 RepID=UPI00177CF53D|nr:uncharacterized protein LOC118735025 [Rhagoletis pomonella]